MATNSTNLISALGAGSGVDVKALAQSLVEAEKNPRKASLDKKIAQSDARISGLGAIRFVLDELKTKFAGLNTVGGLNSISATSSQSASLGVSANGNAKPGTHRIEVTQLARPQRSFSAGYAQATSPINGGQAFRLNLTVGSGATAVNKTLDVAAANASPEGLVLSINAANLGVQAQLVNTGIGATPFQIVITGQEGTANAFSLSAVSLDSSGQPTATAATGLSWSTPNDQTAADAQLNVNGLALVRGSNRINDALTGVTLDLNATNVGNPATVQIARDTSALKTKFKELVAAFNDVGTVLKVTADKDSQVEGYGASLVGDSTVSRVRNQIRALITTPSSTPGSSVTALRDLGLSISKDGVLELDEGKLDTALSQRFDDVVKMLSNNRNTPTTLTSVASGLAGDAVKTLDGLVAPNGLLATQTSSAQKNADRYKLELTRLETRMTELLARYNKQFAAMENLVGQSNKLKDSLKSTFEGMMAAYTNK